MIQDERGIALPFVLAVTVLAFLLTTAALTSYTYSFKGIQMEMKRVRAQYAAESGIARMQQKVCDDPAWNQSLSTPMNGMKTETRIEGTGGNRVRIHSVAKGKKVRQTIRVEVEPKTCEVLRWGP
ncbi:Tfp pilus assembly protein PilX [Kroppenstedtia sanguinis]|uniref:Tfp pilus assembly protein PilV n=1 Tax=Kroppenstedtia sanguinis TaxID=1380684 RepID=A0ABW4C7T6_9BACL